jgi:hypothetical protein
MKNINTFAVFFAEQERINPPNSYTRYKGAKPAAYHGVRAC